VPYYFSVVFICNEKREAYTTPEYYYYQSSLILIV